MNPEEFSQRTNEEFKLNWDLESTSHENIPVMNRFADIDSFTQRTVEEFSEPWDVDSDVHLQNKKLTVENEELKRKLKGQESKNYYLLQHIKKLNVNKSKLVVDGEKKEKMYKEEICKLKESNKRISVKLAKSMKCESKLLKSENVKLFDLPVVGFESGTNLCGEIEEGQNAFKCFSCDAGFNDFSLIENHVLNCVLLKQQEVSPQQEKVYL